MPEIVNTPITPPRVAFFDPRTGNISREWYMFFLSLFRSQNNSQTSLNELQIGPPTQDTIFPAPSINADLIPAIASPEVTQDILTYFVAPPEKHTYSDLAPPVVPSVAASSGGTVTSVNVSGGSTGLVFSGGPITTSGTINTSGTLATANGGTGSSSLAGAGIVTTTSSETISGTKTFSSTGNNFTGSTFRTSDAYFYENTSFGALGGVNGVVLGIGAYPGTAIFIGDSTTWRPTADNTRTLGTASFRYTVVYATTGTINTSDATQKQQIRELSESEYYVAQKVKKLVRAFKWNDAVEQKGNEARIHFGVVAQDVEKAFASEGLDAAKYGVLCTDTWARPDGSIETRFGVRYSELLAFVIAAL